MERERVIKAKEAADDCPEGHILLPDDIRQKHLAALKDSKWLCIYERSSKRKRTPVGLLDKIPNSSIQHT